MIRILLWTVTLVSLFPAFHAQAQPAWPGKLLRIVVPFAAGSFTDVAARLIANELTGQLGQQVIVENRVGAGIKMTHVPFKGVVLSIAEVVAGRIDSSIASLASGMAQVSAGKIQGLGVSGQERSSLLPGVPTFAEAGFPGYDMSYWWGVAAPAATPPQIVSRLNQEIARAADQPKLTETFLKQGARAVTSSPAEFSRRVDEEIKVWKNVIARAGVKVG